MPILCDDISNTEQVKKALHSNIPSLVRVSYVGENKIPGIDATKIAPTILPVFYKHYANEIEAFKVYEDDIWLSSHPKCGTTWTAEMVWLIANELDFHGAKTKCLFERFTFLEQSVVLHNIKKSDETSSVEIARTLPRPRFIQSHHPISLLPTEFWSVKPKLVYVARNPKDVAISFYHHYVNIQRYSGSLEDFLDSFLNDLTLWSPYRDHILNYWKLRNESNILFITYEDMSADLKSVLQKVSKFFNKTYTEDQLNQLAKHLSFSEMKQNSYVNREHLVKNLESHFGKKRVDSNFHLIRRGEVNSAKDEMPIKYQKKFDDWLAEAFENSDFKFNV